MKRLVFPILAALLAAAPLRAADAPTLKAGVFTPPRMAPDFTLQGSDGKELKLSNYRGRLVVLGFGFTSCPDVCPVTLATLAQAHRKLGAANKDVQIVYITVDPARDDVERMHKYLAGFDSTFIGGTGDPERLDAVRKEYGVLAEKKMYGSNYTIGHSSSIYLIDREGLLRALMPYGRSPDDYVHDLQILMKR
jgi:protein SCO1/2